MTMSNQGSKFFGERAMKRFLICVILAVVLMANAAQAARGKLYASGSLTFGVLAKALDVQSDIGIDTGLGLIVALGYDMNKFRFEGEITLRNYSFDEIEVDGVGTVSVDGDFFSLSYMVNGYYDFKVRRSPHRPYVGLGIGVTHVDVDLKGLHSEGSTEMAYQVMAGISFRYSRNVFLRAGYRLFGYTDNDGIVVHELNIGAGFMF